MLRAFICFILILTCLHPLKAHDKDKILITINQFVSHPALDDVKEGVLKALEKRGLQNQVEIIEANAQGNISQSVQIAKYQASLQPRFMIAIATPSAQANLKAKAKDTLLAFAAVSDPTAAGLDHDPTTLGVTDTPPLEDLLTQLRLLLPNLKSIGVVYNPGEINSVKTVERLKHFAKENNLTLKEASVNVSTNVKLAAQGLVGKVEAIYLPQDNLVISAIGTVIEVSKKEKMPVVSNDPSLIEKGLLLAVGGDYYKSGWQLGNMIADTIEGKVVHPHIQSLSIKECKVNKKVARALGVTLPKTLSCQGAA